MTHIVIYRLLLNQILSNQASKEAMFMAVT